MASFQRLPNELLDQIFNHFSFDKTKSEDCYEEDMHALASISLQRKHFQLLAEPLLYHTFIKPANTDLADLSDLPKVVHLLQHQNTRLRKYLRTLLSRSDLARLVKTLILHPWHTEDSLAIETHLEIPALFVPQSEDLLCFPKSLMPLPRTDDFWAAFCAGNEDAEVALLLHLTCNIEELDINFHQTWIWEERFYFRQLLQEAARAEIECPFKSLRRLSAGGPLSEMTIPGFLRQLRDATFDIANIAEFISLPSVKELTTHRASDYEFHSRNPLAGVQTKITSMSHHNSELSGDALTLLVQSCECLKSLEISPSESFSFTTWRETMTSISSKRDNLEDLTLHTYIRDWDCRGLDDLKLFQHLKHLRIGANTLLSNDAWLSTFADKEDANFTLARVLPPSLETLTVFRASLKCVPALERLLASLPQGPPGLRTIILRLHDIARSLLITNAANADVRYRYAALKRGFGALSIDLAEETDYTYWLTRDHEYVAIEYGLAELNDDLTTIPISG